MASTSKSGESNSDISADNNLVHPLFDGKYFKIKSKDGNKKCNPDVPRKFFVSGKIPSVVYQEIPKLKFIDNTIKTSKYTMVNFLPKNLFGQFRRIANFYFLCLCIIHFGINSPVSPVTTLLPLIFVVVVTGIKQGFEDWKRHREDKKVNRAPTIVFKDGKLQESQRFRIRVGDIVKVSSNEEFPCDLLFLVSSGAKPKCEVTTANLDGETNLKTFLCPFDATDLISEKDLATFSAMIECQHPNPNLYDFKGRMEFFKDETTTNNHSLSTEHLLLRGARLKNTDFIYGCAVYTGKETKMALNSKMTTNKFSTAERTCNCYLLIYLVLLLAEVIFTTVLKYMAFGAEKTEDMWYLGPITVSLRFKAVLQDGFSFFILFSYIIPISLYVTLEMQKFLGSFFFVCDEEMKCEETGEYAICNTSDLNEELGQVGYLLTDKTGTLTENSMNFRQCSIAGVKFIDKKRHLRSIDTESIEPFPQNILELLEFFLISLALCHTVQAKKVFSSEDKCGSKNGKVDDDDDKQRGGESIPLGETEWEYHASSPDEKALLEACALYGIVFEGEKGGNLILRIQGKRRSFELLEVLEFDHDRKLMSVIVRDVNDRQIWVMSKGAESSIFKRCLLVGSDAEVMREITMKHIDDFAGLGLRTLAVAKKEMNEEEYEVLSKKLSIAKQEIQNREMVVRSIMDEIENGFTLIGATGIEDLLQEGVQETLESLSVAGIKVWILTGDKVETAVNVAHLCGLFKRFMPLIYLTHLDGPVGANLKLEESEKELKNADTNFGLVVDGGSLLLLLEEFRQAFYQVCSQCSAVVCCRMSPKQKAEIVKLVKSCSRERTVCAAIGDGANDVSMIQEADIGLGIMGKEGRQAVRCSDFALARFRFLQRAFLVHGHWYYTRIATLILYCFYKNVAFITPQVFFTFNSAFSTQNVYEGLVLTLFNVTFTGLPIVIYGLFEQVYSAEKLLSKPYLYKEIRRNRNLSKSVFLMWSLLGLWHASVLYYGLLAATHDTAYLPKGRTQDLYLFGMMLTTNVVIICNLKLMLESRFQTWFFLASIIFSIVFIYLAYFIYCATLPTLTMFWAFYVMHTTPVFYLSSVVLIITCLLPDLLIRIFCNTKTFLLRDLLKRYITYN